MHRVSAHLNWAFRLVKVGDRMARCKHIDQCMTNTMTEAQRRNLEILRSLGQVRYYQSGNTHKGLRVDVLTRLAEMGLVQMIGIRCALNGPAWQFSVAA